MITLSQNHYDILKIECGNGAIWERVILERPCGLLRHFGQVLPAEPVLITISCKAQQIVPKNGGEKSPPTKKRNKIPKPNKNMKNTKPNKNSKTTKQNTQIKLLHLNAAGLKHKTEDLKNKIKYFGSSIISIQETHHRKKGKFKADKFKVFESIRKNKERGGSMLIIHEDLSPILIKEYNESFELLVVEVQTEKKPIRVITGYGPQETWREDERMPFWLALDEEISTAELNGRSVIIQMDANAKLGKSFIRDDPHMISGNGKILAGIVERHAMTVMNGLTKKCYGTITRERITLDSSEKSVIDFMIISNDLSDHIENMHIDEDRINVLTKIVNKRSKGTKGLLEVKETDHNTITAELNINWNENYTAKSIEVFKFNDKDSLKTFKELTSNTNQLSKVFENNKDLNVQTKKFLKRLKGFVSESFKKVKITNKPNKELERLYDKRRILRSQKNDLAKKELATVEKELADKYGEQMYKYIKEEIECIDSEDGGFNSGKLWKLKKKLSPSNFDPPTAMKDSDGHKALSKGL